MSFRAEDVLVAIRRHYPPEKGWMTFTEVTTKDAGHRADAVVVNRWTNARGFEIHGNLYPQPWNTSKMNSKNAEEMITHIFARSEPRGDCIVWVGANNRRNRGGGYGVTFFRGRTHIVHRLLYGLLVAEILPGMDVCHLCDERSCINPAHLFLGSRLDNMRDAAMKGRTAHARAGKPPSNRIVSREMKQRAFVMRAAGATGQQIAEELGVSRSTAYNLITGAYAYV